MKRLIPLTLALILTGSAAIAGPPDPPIPFCNCELCALDGEQTCQDYWTGLYHICGWYDAVHCR